MDFSTANALPIRVTINGTAYELPRFLNQQFKAWVARRQQMTRDAALVLLPDADARARFSMYFNPAPLDLAALMDEATTPEGAEYVNEACMAAGGVPEDVRKSFHANVDPMMVRELAQQLASNRQAAAGMQEASGDPGPRGNPPIGQPPTSAGLPATISATSPTTSELTPDATKAA